MGAKDEVDSNKELVCRWVEDIFNSRNLDECGQIVADRYTEHALAPFGREEPGEVAGPDHMRRTMEWLVAQYPDLHFDIEEVIAEGDRVACLVRSHGTNTGPLNGVMPPTGKRFNACQTHWFRIKDGKLAEHWATRDDLTAMIQLGLVPAPGSPGNATAK